MVQLGLSVTTSIKFARIASDTDPADSMRNNHHHIPSVGIDFRLAGDRILGSVMETEDDLVTIEDIEIVQTGIEYNLASGPKTFTVNDLRDAVESQNDAAIKAPRLKLGHSADIGLLADGQPAIGTLRNLRLEKSGHLVLGDYVGIPQWLAKVLPSAYPARSIEALTGVKTSTGNQWRLVITDLALLGVVWPGVGTLDDIKALYSAEGPDNVTIYSTKEEFETAKITAQINNEDILRQYREQKTPEQMWWWVHAMMRDPDELVVEDEDKGTLYRIPYNISGETVEFGDPVPVKIVFKDKPTPKKKQEARARLSEVLASSNREEFNRMTITTGIDPVALRDALGLEDSATDEEVNTALAAAGFITPPGHESRTGRAAGSEQSGTNDAGAAAPPSSADQPDVENEGESPNNPSTARPTHAPTPSVAAVGTPDIIHMDRPTYDRLISAAETVERLDQRDRTTERDRVIATAVTDTKIEPSRVEAWRRKWDADPEGTRTLLTASFEQGGLAPGVIPVSAVGGEPPIEDTTADAYPSDWLPDVQRGDTQGHSRGIMTDG